MNNEKLKNGAMNEIFLSRVVDGECFKLIPPVDSKVLHGPYFSLEILSVNYDHHINWIVCACSVIITW